MNRLDKRLLFNQKQSAEIYGLIAKIEAISGQWQIGKKLSPQMISRLKTSVLITSTGASTRIEGSKLTDEEVEELYSNLRIKKFKTRDEQEVAGYIELLKKIFNSWKTLSFSEGMIKNFHREVMKYSQKDQSHCGKYKFGLNRVEAVDTKGQVIGTIFSPSPPYLVPKEMLELIEWTQAKLKVNDNFKLLIITNFKICEYHIY